MFQTQALMKFLDPRWHEKEVKDSFVFNIILGITIILIFSVVLKDSKIKQEAINWYFDQYTLWRMDADEDSFIDKYILFQKAADKETRKIAHEKIMFLDFDNDAMESLNRFNLTPRDKIADLIQTAYKGGASIIVVDMDFSEPDRTPASLMAGDEFALSGFERDKILYDILKTIRDDPNSKTKVLLPRMTYLDRTEQPNIFSELADGEKIFEVTPMLTEYSSSTRFWLPYLKTENADTGKPYILWSIPIMTMALTYGNLEELTSLEQEILNDTDENMSEYLLKVKRQGVEENFPIYEEIYLNGGVVRDTQASQYNRIQYVIFPAGVKSSKPISGNIEPANLWHWRRNEPADFQCKDKIVIIGRSDDKCNDFHVTPAGRMPGMYIHANSIATALSSSRPHLCSLTMHVMIELFLVIIAAYVFLNLTGSIVGYIILFMFGACWVVPFFYYCFTNEYIFLNMAFMSLGFYNVSKVIENVSWQSVSEIFKIFSMHERK